MVQIYTAPDYTYQEDGNTSIFLAGTIDSGDSENWQEQLSEILSLHEDLDLHIFNPRREYWPDSNDNEEVTRQILWEQEHLDKADIIIMNILGDSKSPISLLELGLYARSGKLAVFCPEEFYRFENVRQTCKAYNIPLIKTNNLLMIYTYIMQKLGAIKC